MKIPPENPESSKEIACEDNEEVLAKVCEADATIMKKCSLKFARLMRR